MPLPHWTMATLLPPQLAAGPAANCNYDKCEAGRQERTYSGSPSQSLPLIAPTASVHWLLGNLLPGPRTNVGQPATSGQARFCAPVMPTTPSPPLVVLAKVNVRSPQSRQVVMLPPRTSVAWLQSTQ